MLLFLAVAFVLFLLLAYHGQTWLAWVLPLAVVIFGFGFELNWSPPVWWSLGVLAVLATLGGVKPLRENLVTRLVLPIVKPILPRMSETEKIAIEAGTVWWEAEFFTGEPDFQKLYNFQFQELTPKERAFLDGPCEELAGMVDDWKVQRDGDLPERAWKFIREQGFMGMIIPEEYGGLGFSALAHSAVVTKLSSRSVAAAVTVMVPNSLGPAELLLHYGTDEQKNHYLPRLAKGDEVPCFALTEPHAGSDAGSMQSTGVVCRGTYEGKEQLGLRLDWDKRYITLSPVATVIGLAFKLSDPDGLLGTEKELGITCALIPADLPGITIGERHDPLGTAFMNGPTQGKSVFVPIDFIIGGRAQAGRGWLMLMQSLAAGRGISLPSMATGAGMLATRVVGAYATVRKQFKLEIGRFEGVEEPLARIAGMTYLMDAARVMTAGAVDAGERPSVASAIVKCYLTEGMRDVTNDAMDIMGGAAICQGERNLLAGAYKALPIGITVEGANILTRTMIIFGQGAIRCHPFVPAEMASAFAHDIPAFDRAFWGHVGFVMQNVARSFSLGLSAGRFQGTQIEGATAPWAKRWTRMSAAYALAADVAMGTLGGSLKRKEKLTGRLADCLAWMYLASAGMKRFHCEGERAEHRAVFEWTQAHALHQAEEAYRVFCQNLPFRPAAWFLRAVAFPIGFRAAPPSDRLGGRVARGLLDGNVLREDLTKGMFLPAGDGPGLGLLEAALTKVVAAQVVDAKLKRAVRDKRLEKHPAATLVERALRAGILERDDEALLATAAAARHEAITVDAFPRNERSLEKTA
ncbi:MAG: acyl-CoA dehydrogenase [Planctomycetota bacterium]